MSQSVLFVGESRLEGGPLGVIATGSTTSGTEVSIRAPSGALVRDSSMLLFLEHQVLLVVCRATLSVFLLRIRDCDEMVLFDPS